MGRIGGWLDVKDNKPPGLVRVFNDAGVNAEVAKIGIGRMVERGEDTLQCGVLPIGGNIIGGISLGESTIQLDKEVGIDKGTDSILGDFRVSSASKLKINKLNLIYSSLN
jgi:hypothetical protein